MSLPKKEIEEFIRTINLHKEYLIPDYVYSLYKEKHQDVFIDPFDKHIAKRIQSALIEKTPFSAIRIGDGEANILTYDLYPTTPTLNQFVFEKIVNKQQDSFSLITFGN